MAYADEFYDSQYQLSATGLKEWDPVAETRNLILELEDDRAALSWALTIPRRLGGDATPDQLAADKKYLRKCLHVVNTAIKNWCRITGDEPDQELSGRGDVKTAGAQLVVSGWLRTQIDLAETRRGRLVTQAIQTGNRKFANQAASYLSDHLDSCTKLFQEF